LTFQPGIAIEYSLYSRSAIAHCRYKALNNSDRLF
jgi:hypothetical protein